VPFDVVECNKYYDASQPDIHDMYQTAWILQTNKSSKQYGFTPYKEWQKEHKDEEVLPGRY